MALRVIAYCSEARGRIGWDKVDDLARESAAFNMQAGVTGLLLFDGVRFLQYLEGPEDGLAVAYSRVQAANSHANIVELGRGRTSRRLFPYWTMRALPAAESEVRKVACSDWTCFVSRVGNEDDLFSGVAHLAQLAKPHVLQSAAGQL